MAKRIPLDRLFGIAAFVHSALETADLWEASYLLTRGARFAGLRLQGNGHTTAFFLVEGEDLPDLARAYRDGHAVAPVHDLRTRMNELRDRLFERLREKEGRSWCPTRGTSAPDKRTRS